MANAQIAIDILRSARLDWGVLRRAVPVDPPLGMERSGTEAKWPSPEGEPTPQRGGAPRILYWYHRTGSAYQKYLIIY